MKRLLAAAVALSFLVGVAIGMPAAQAGEAATPKGADRTQALVEAASRAWLAAEWASYASRFVTSEGRVVDNGNGNVSHSESQGYGLLLAAKAGDAARFQTIWAWTARTLLVRKDGLAAWKWEPGPGKVTDLNNATDGDILIAWALGLGAERFNRPDYRQAAVGIAEAVAARAVAPTQAGLALMPGSKGFGPGEQPDGPVVNLSYWVFPAFPVLAELAPSGADWAAVRRTGLRVLEGSRFGAHGLPSDWVSLGGARPQPAKAFPPGFGYNAVRIPLYLAWDGGADARASLRRFAGAWTQTSSSTEVLAGREAAVTVPVGQPGYDLLLALARCAAGQAIPPEMISTRSALYYPETLRLLSVIALQERLPACL